MGFAGLTPRPALQGVSRKPHQAFSFEHWHTHVHVTHFNRHTGSTQSTEAPPHTSCIGERISYPSPYSCMHAGRWRAPGFLYLLWVSFPTHAHSYWWSVLANLCHFHFEGGTHGERSFWVNFQGWRIAGNFHHLPPRSPNQQPKSPGAPYMHPGTPRIWLYISGCPHCSLSSVATRSFLSDILKPTRHLLPPS